MNVLLIYPTTDYVPLGSLYLANSLEKEGIRTTLLPVSATDDELEKRLNEPLTAVGMSVITSKELTDFVDKSKKIKTKNIPTIWGGVHSTLNAEQIVEEDYIDYVVKGQAEEILPQVVKSLPLRKKIFEGTIGSLDDQYPAWDKVNLSDCLYPEEHSMHSERKIKDKIRNNIFYYLITSRGCPYKCSFCSENLPELNNTQEGRRWNPQSADYVKEQITFLQESLMRQGKRMDGIGFWDDMFWLNQKRADDILDFVHQQDLGYLIEARANYLLEDNHYMFRRLSHTNCLQVFVGAESASQETLDGIIGKGNKVEDYDDLVELARGYELPVRFSFIVGFPYETDESVNQTLDYVERLKTKPFVSVSGPKMFTPYPGTLEYQRAIERGFIPPTNNETWANINRNPQGYDKTYPWIKENLHKKTVERLKHFI